MAYGLIQDTTLTALANGLRDKGIVSQNAVGSMDFLAGKSPNATSVTDPTPLYAFPDFASPERRFTVSIPDATSIEFEVTIGVGTTVSGSTLGYIYFYADNGDTATHNIRVRASSNGLVSTVTISSNLVGINVYNSLNTDDEFAIIYKAYPLDASGKRIPFIGETGEINTVTPSEMVDAINNYEVPIEPPEEAFNITDNLSDKFTRGMWDWFIELYGDKIVTKDVTSLGNTFSYSEVEEIPFVLNVLNITSLASAFYSMKNLRVCPKVRGVLSMNNTSFTLSSAIDYCKFVSDFEDLFEPEMLDGFNAYKSTSATSCPRAITFNTCCSMRRVPSWWYKFRINEASTAFPKYNIYNSGFASCYVLDEITNIPVLKCQGNLTSNMLGGIAQHAYRLKSLTFETDNGQPIEANWKSQVLALDYNTGYTSTPSLDEYGIAKDKKAIDDASYQALKNDPDWWGSLEYARYNHDSAVETINSLPDTSAYLASAGGTNTIRFKGSAGSLTDGGAINTLTEEEIAVAAAKGWTVTLS